MQTNIGFKCVHYGIDFLHIHFEFTNTSAPRCVCIAIAVLNIDSQNNIILVVQIKCKIIDRSFFK